MKKKTKGVAVKIEHFFLDELWNYGSQQINISDSIKRVLIKNADGSAPTATEETKEEVTKKGEGEDEVATESAAKDGEGEEVKEAAIEEEKIGEQKVEESNELTPDQMDNLIIRNFMFCLVRHVKEKDLPMEPSKLQGDLMHKYEHSEDGKINFKKSSFKKVTKFLKKMKQRKLISFSKPKGFDHEIITEIHRKSKSFPFTP